MRKVVLGLTLAFVFWAQSASFSQSAVGYDFLRTDIGARPSAMGGAFVAVRGDIHSINYNPAGLSALHERQGTVSYLNHLLDFQSGFLGYVQPIRKGTGAVAINFYDFGTFEGRDENDLETGDFGANGLVLSAGYSEEVLQNFSVGLTGKYIRFQIDNFNASAVAADLGAIYSLPQQALSFGFGIFNLGTTTSAFIDTKDDLPMNLQLGFTKNLEHLPVMVSGALVKFNDENLDFRIGGEISVSEKLLLRLGYNSVGQDQNVDTDKDKFAGVSFGFGVKLNKINLDYSLSSFGEVGSLNRLSVIGRF